MLCWSLASARWMYLRLWNCLAVLISRHAAPLLSKMKAMVCVAWAFAVVVPGSPGLRGQERVLFRAISRVAADPEVLFWQHMKSRNLSILCWSFASMGYKDEAFFARVTWWVVRRALAPDVAPEWLARDLTILLYSYASLRMDDPVVFDLLGTLLSDGPARLPADFSTHDASLCIWSCALVHFQDAAVPLALLHEKVLARDGFLAEAPQAFHLSAIAWGCATLSYLKDSLFILLRNAFYPRHQFHTAIDAQGVTNLSWAFAVWARPEGAARVPELPGFRFGPVLQGREDQCRLPPRSIRNEAIAREMVNLGDG
eukprot:NODE_2038_length_1219_cov_4.400000_g1692_i0.p1 GENE.NODE_2038_length_1219_cov_4.400000_g1692_i0~~NODE_2038_length_1219_cov_4.400000_g1692_i0.p1  ORF type:complete len:358 (+),score=82.00 NODE_2038_length_1219_cov_4.400000_g1692_i0:138-1076(+)